MSTRVEQLIKQKEQEIENIRATAYREQVAEVVNNKKSTEQDVYDACKAFTANVEKKMRQANLQKARAERKNNPKPKQPKQEAPIPA